MLNDWLEDQPPALIFQGEDPTLVLDMNGTFWSLRKSDTGFVKSLQWIARVE
ncbi:hypothetical protein [Streptomyces lavendofoliae]|uniref:hypothetical protein n=1 Tax=Streptomyces lavendofoliae TaxID=67314 RepID=UPI003D90E196